MTDQQATAIAHAWIDAWNSHDIERILSHYGDTVQLTSPLVERILGPGRSMVHGKDALRAYFLRGLETYPHLLFRFQGAYPGESSLVVQYESVRGLRAAEFMRLDGMGRACEVVAHYASAVG